MTFRTAHLADDDLLSLCLEPDEPGRSTLLQHVDVCTECMSRWDSLRTMLDRVQDDLRDEADEVFTSDHLDRQREQIRRRLDTAGRLARVLEFPAASRARQFERPGSRVAMRWVATAAVVGLLVGVGTGVLIDHRSHQATLSVDRATAAKAPGVRGLPSRIDTAASVMSDDQFLSDVETAVEAARAAELQALDDFTPRIQEVAVNLR